MFMQELLLTIGTFVCTAAMVCAAGPLPRGLRKPRKS
jgi:hypothetical protein